MLESELKCYSKKLDFIFVVVVLEKAIMLFGNWNSGNFGFLNTNQR